LLTFAELCQSMRFLIVEDDAVLRDVLTRSLSEAGHRVDAAATCAEAESFWTLQPYDAVVLDLNLPDGSGLTALKNARRRGDTTPVLVLTARNRTDERIAGLDAGADDYVGKPFELTEVEARLRALVRRSQGGKDRVEVGQLTLDRSARRFFINEVPLDLPAREFEVLWELASKPGRVISKRLLSDKLSGFDDALGDNALEAFISRLRRKLQNSGATIRTLRGLGYLLEVET
jgi:two-component system, OmpR family, response regulator